MSAIEVRILGATVVEVDGRAMDLGGARQRQLVAALVLRRNQLVPVDDLADRLWPDEQPMTAVKTIQVYVSRLRALLGAEASRLETAPGGYRFRLTDTELDAARFEAEVRRARELLAVDPGAAEAALNAALGAWRGPALADVATLPFARAEADRLEGLRDDSLDDVDEARIRTGRAREAVARLTAAVRERPERERSWAQLMRALYADGRQVEALAAYRRARTYLSQELGLEPGPELQALEGAILRHDRDVLGLPWSTAQAPRTGLQVGLPVARPVAARTWRRFGAGGLVAGALALVLVVTVIRPNPGSSAARPTPSVAPPVATAAPPPGVIVVAPDLLDGTWRPTEVAPGRWTFEKLQPSITVETTTTWFAGADGADYAALVHNDPPTVDGGVIWEINFVRPELVLDKPCYLPDSSRILDAGASTFIEWLKVHPLLTLGVIRAFNVGRFPGFEVDASVSRAKTAADCPEDAQQAPLLHRIPLFPAAGHAVPLFVGDKARFIAADVGDGPPLIIIIRASAADWDAAIAEAEPVVESLVVSP